MKRMNLNMWSIVLSYAILILGLAFYSMKLHSEEESLRSLESIVKSHAQKSAEQYDSL